MKPLPTLLFVLALVAGAAGVMAVLGMLFRVGHALAAG
jgi:hypothetical protein